MFDFIIVSIVWILAIYGFIEIVKTILSLFIKIKFKNDGIFLIIAVKNQENKIEGFIRTFLFRWIYGKEEYISDIYVIDLNSEDRTNEILEKLKNDYAQIKVYDWKQCKELLEEK